jgi:hypothetical protein
VKLAMYLGNDLIASIPLSPELIIRPGYIKKFVRQLKKENDLLLGADKAQPEFFIIYPTPQKNSIGACRQDVFI